MGNTEYFQAFYVDISHKNAVEMIQADLEKRGLVTFDQVYSFEELRLFCSKLGETLMHRDSDEYGVTRIINREMALSEDGWYLSRCHFLALQRVRASACCVPICYHLAL